LYATTLAPGVDFWDTGEMQTVPYVLGIAHPTGFPLFIVIGWAFSHAVPLGDVARRLSLFSATASALAAWLLFVFVRDRTKSTAVGLAAALTFAAGDVVWTRAIRAEVHDVALAFTALGLTAAARAGATASARALTLAALALGLALAVHPVALLALPAALAFAWPAAIRSARSAPQALGALTALAAPLLLYAYVPLRSAYVEARGLDPGGALGIAGGAFFDYGAPSTPRAFATYVTGATFRPGEAFVSFASAGGMHRALALAQSVLFREFGVVTLAFALVGFGVLAVRERRIAAGVALLACGALAFVPNFSVESDALRYALPALWMLAACAAVGVDWLARAIVPASVRATPVIAACALVAAAVPQMPRAARDVAHDRAYDDARAEARIVAARTVDGSLVVATWAYATPLAYAAYVEHAFGTRRVLSGWPHDYPGRYGAWRQRFGHVYFVVGSGYDISLFARTLYATERWRLAELR